MDTADPLNSRASELVEAAQAFRAAAEQPTSLAVAHNSLASLEEALQALSAAWYQLAANRSPGSVEACHRSTSEASSSPHVTGLSREREARVTGTLHDVAAAFASCARACREGRARVTPIIARRTSAGRVDERGRSGEPSWFESQRRMERVP